jgi:hypothetical protein
VAKIQLRAHGRTERPTRGHAHRRRLRRHGRPRALRRMAARARRRRRRRAPQRHLHASSPATPTAPPRSTTARRGQDRNTEETGARPRRDRRRRRHVLGRQAVHPRRQGAAARGRLPRDRPLAGARHLRQGPARLRPDRCDVYYQGKLSPDFYAWIFPHGETTSIGVGTELKGFSLHDAVTSCARRPASISARPCAARAHRSRCIRWRSGTTTATSCSPATPPASSHRPPARASTMPWWAAGSPRDAVEELLVTGNSQGAGHGPQALHEGSTGGCSGSSASCSASGTRTTSAASASSASATTRTSRT